MSIEDQPIDRRNFLKNSATLVGLGATVPAFLQQTVLAAARAGRSRFKKDDHILLVVQLAGGNDGLNTIVPVTNDEYYKLRPRLALPKDDTLKLTSDLHLHGSASALKALYDDGYLAILQNVGYPNPNRSHFRSMDIWHTASPDGRKHNGWLGRFFDNTCRGADGCDATNAIALMGESPLALRGDRFLPLAFEDPGDLGWRAAVPNQPTGQAVAKLNQPKPRAPAKPRNELEYLRRVALKARLSADDIHRATAGGSAGAEFPNRPFARSLETVARLIGANLPTRVYYVSQGGYDTHVNQVRTHARLLDELGRGLQAFMAAMKVQGNLDRVLILTFSEFGRRVAQNASEGTDHGAAAPAFLLGSGVKSGLHGSAPDLKNLLRGDLRYKIDFRSIYASVLDHWLGTPSDRILGGSFPTLDLFTRR